MAALRSRCGHYIVVLFLSSFFLVFPRLISAVGDWMSTILPHMVGPYCEFRAGLSCAARGSLEIAGPKNRQKSPSAHHRTNLSGSTKARIDNRKKIC